MGFVNVDRRPCQPPPKRRKGRQKRATAYQARQAILASQVIPPGAILFLGDSIVAGVEWDRFLSEPSAISVGIGGDRIRWLTRRISDLALQNAAEVHIQIGINDIRDRRPPETIPADYRALIARIREQAIPGTGPVRTSSMIPPAGSTSRLRVRC